MTSLSISYSPLNILIDTKGYSLQKLVELEVISDFAARSIRKDDPVSLKQIENICVFFNVSIEQVVRISKD